MSPTEGSEGTVGIRSFGGKTPCVAFAISSALGIVLGIVGIVISTPNFDGSESAAVNFS